MILTSFSAPPSPLCACSTKWSIPTGLYIKSAHKYNVEIYWDLLLFCKNMTQNDLILLYRWNTKITSDFKTGNLLCNGFLAFIQRKKRGNSVET